LWLGLDWIHKFMDWIGLYAVSKNGAVFNSVTYLTDSVVQLMNEYVK